MKSTRVILLNDHYRQFKRREKERELRNGHVIITQYNDQSEIFSELSIITTFTLILSRSVHLLLQPTIHSKKHHSMSRISSKELKKLKARYPYLTFPYLNSRKKAVSTFTYSFTIYRPKHKTTNEIHVIFRGASEEDTLIFVLPPELSQVLQDTWQSTWPKLSEISMLPHGVDMLVHEILTVQQVRAVIRSVDTWIS